MALKDLINDFYLEKTQEVPSEDKVNNIIQTYGENTDDLINDLYVEYTGEQPGADKLNVIKETYFADSIETDPPKKKDETLQDTSQEEVMVSSTNGEEVITSSESSEVKLPESTDVLPQQTQLQEEQPQQEIENREELEKFFEVADPMTGTPKMSEVFPQLESIEITETEEQPTALERKYGKNIFTDFFGDIWRAGTQGAYQGFTVDDALNVLYEGSNIKPKALEAYIEEVKTADSYEPSDEMKDFQRIYDEEGRGVFGVLKGLANNPSVIPQVMTSSLVSMVTGIKGTGPAMGAGAAGGFAVGTAGGPLAPVTIPTATIAGAIGAGTATLETALTFTELLKEELGDKEFTKENVMAVLNDPEKLNSLRFRSAARGGTIGVINGITGGLSSAATTKVLTKTGSLGKSIATGTGIEMAGGGVGETAGRAVAGQEMDVAEIALETVAPLGQAPITVGTGVFRGRDRINNPLETQQSSYSINGQKVSKEFMEGVINSMTLEDATVSNVKLNIEDDPELTSQLNSKIEFLQNENNVQGPYSAADRSRIAALTTELNNTPEVIGNEVRRGEIENEIKSIQDKYVVSDAEVDAEIARRIETGEKTSDVSTVQEREIIKNELQKQKDEQNRMDVSETETTVDEFGNVTETETLDIQVTNDFVLEKLNEDGITNPTDDQIQTKKQELIQEARKIAEGKTNDELIELSKSNEDIPVEIRLEDQTTPSKISHLPDVIELIHLSKKQKDISPDIDLSEVPDSDKYGGGDSFVEGLYLSDSPLWNEGSVSRLPNYEGANKVKIKNDGLIFFDDAVGFEAYVREKYGKELEGLNDLEFQKKVKELLVNDGVKGVLSKSFDGWANELVVLDPSIIISSESSPNTPGEYNPELYENTTRLPRSRYAVKKEQEFIELNKTKQDAIQEPSPEGVPVQESPGDSETVVEGVSESEVTPQETTQEEVEAEVTQDEKVDDKKPRTSKVDEGPKRGYQIDKDLDEIVATDKVEEGRIRKGPVTLLEREKQQKEKRESIRNKLKEKGYTDRQVDLAIARKDRQAAQELKNLKADLQEQGRAQKKYTVKATKEFKQKLKDIINGMAGEKNISLTKGQLNKILDAATGSEMQGLDVDAALDKAIVEVERSVRKAYINDITKNMKKSAVEYIKKKGKNRGKISVEQRKLWNEYTQNLTDEDIKNMSLDELQALDEELNAIITEGKSDVQNMKILSYNAIQKQKGAIDEGLYRNAPSTNLDNPKQIEEFLSQNKNNFVIINGREINGVGPFKKYMQENPTGGLSAKGYTATTSSEAQATQRRSSFVNAARRFFKSYETIDNMTQKLKRLGGPRVAKAIDNLTQKTLDAQVDYIKGTRLMSPKLQKAVNESGITDRALNKKSTVQIGNSNKTLTNNEVAYMYAMQRVNGNQAIVNSNINPQQLNEYIEANPDIKKLADNIADMMKNEAVPRYRNHFEYATGVPLEDSEFYIPTFRDVGEEAEITLEAMNQNGEYNGKDIISRHMKAKTDNNQGIKIMGITDAAARYINEMERSMAFFPAAEEYNVLFNNNTIPRMQQILGKDGANDVGSIMGLYDEAIIGQRRGAKTKYDEIAGAFSGLNRFATVKTLGLKPKLLVGQLLSAIHYYPLTVTDKRYGLGYKDIFKSGMSLFNPKEKVATETGEKDVYFMSRFVTDPQFKDRWSKIGIDPTLEKYQSKGNKPITEAFNSLVDLMTMGIRTGDMGGVFGGAPVAKALYDKNISKGMDSDIAYDRAMKDYYRLTTKYQQTNNPLFTPAYSKSDLGKILAPYTSATNAVANELAVTIKKIREPNQNRNDRINNLRRFMYLGVPAVGLYTALQGDFLEEGEEIEDRMKFVPEATNEARLNKDRAYGLGMNTLQGVGGGFGPLASLGNYIVNEKRGRPPSFSIPFLLNETVNFYQALDPVSDILTMEKSYEDLSNQDKKRIDLALGQIKKFFDQGGSLLSGDISASDFIMGRGEDYGKKDKMSRYEQDKVRNLIFQYGKPQKIEPLNLEGLAPGEFTRSTIYDQETIYD